MNSRNIMIKIYSDLPEPHLVNVDRYPFTFGRSIKNSCVVDKLSVSANHVLIDIGEDGPFLLDCGSTNGVYFRGEKVHRIKIDQNMTVFMASVKMEIFFQDDYLEKTQELQLPEFFLMERDKKKTILKMLGSFLFFLIPEILKIFFTDPITKDNYEGFLLEVLGMGVLSLISAGAFSLFSKIHCKKYQFLSFLWIVNIGMGVISLYSFLPIYFYFNLGIYRAKNFFDQAFLALLACVIIYNFARILFPRVSKHRVILILSTLLISATLIRVSILHYHERWGSYDYQGTIAYPLFNYSEGANPLENLIQKVNDSVEVVDQYRQVIRQRNEEENVDN